MNQEIFDWILLFLRWLHIVVGVSWIGASIFFMWLDRSFKPDPENKTAGHVGHLWMVHGGGFYRVEKMLMGSVPVPKDLHWFKWESYWTWMSGVALLVLIFYTSGGTFLLDTSVSSIGFLQAIMIGVGSILVSWVFYDLLWESSLTKTKPIVGHFLTLIWLGAVSFLLCETLSGRAAYIHVGAMLGTWMTANVFLRIIPRQVKMVEAAKRGEPVNQEWAKNAKARSTHNTYFTLPVIFIMLSNHFPSTYGNTHPWVILMGMCVVGASVREYFIVRISNPKRAYGFAFVAGLVGALVVFFSQENRGSSPPPVAAKDVISLAPAQPGAAGPLGRVSIRGVVKFEGPVPIPQKLQMPPGCESPSGGDVFLDDIVVKDGKLKNVFVRVTKGLDLKSVAPPPIEPVKVDQVGCVYVPRVIGVRVGQPVEFINSDPIFHNVRSISKQNENFNVATPQKNDRVLKVFSKPEVLLQTKCSVHPWMGAHIAVVEHPYFDVTDDQGGFSIRELPEGTYTIEAWHEVYGTQTASVEVRPGVETTLEFVFKGKAK